MLEKLITNLKKSLPGAKKNEETDMNEENEEESSQEESEGSDNNDASSDDKKKKISMAIRVAVIIGLGYVAVDHFFLSTPEPTIDQLTAAAPKRKRKPLPPKEEVKTEPAAVAATPALEEKIETAPPVESINVLDKTTAEEPPLAVEEPETPATSVGESNLDQRLDQLIDNVEKKEDPVAATPSMEDKIVQEEAYIAPPAYNLLGRGLVYNCKDKYWACIDKPSYVACNKNMKWHAGKGNAKECVVQNVYSSEEDCIKVQKYNVSVNQATSFCQ